MHFIKKLELLPKILYLGLIPLMLNLISEFPIGLTPLIQLNQNPTLGHLSPSDHNYTLTLHLPREHLKIINSDKCLKLLPSLPRVDTSKLAAQCMILLLLELRMPLHRRLPLGIHDSPAPST